MTLKGQTSGSTTLIATAGHVDHGKTSLIRCLTGVDTDRLPEEKAREISIECGFAQVQLEDQSLTFVDVPGHERFIRQMVGGIAGMDAALLVIAADDGPMPQTFEHLDICEFIGIPELIVVITRSDLVEADWLELMQLEVQGIIDASPWPQAPIIPCSAVTGANLDQVRAALVALGRARGARARPRGVALPFAMPIDRVFSAPGFGTVITGTSLAGEVRLGDEVCVSPMNHGFSPLSRVRSIERQGLKVSVGGPSERLALNLSDLPREAFSRGALVYAAGGAELARVLEAWLMVSTALAAPLKRGQALTLQVGLATANARVFSLNDEGLAAGEAGPVELRLDRALPVVAGMPFVLRGFERIAGRGLTVAGGLITDARERPAPPRSHPERAAFAEAFRRSDGDGLVAAWLRDAGLAGVDQGSLAQRLLRMPKPFEFQSLKQRPLAFAGRAYDDAAIAHFMAVLGAFLDGYHRDEPGELGFPAAELEARLVPLLGAARARAEDLGPLISHALLTQVIVRRDAFLARPSFTPLTPAMEASRQEALSSILETAGLMPPWRDSLSEAIALATGLPAVSAERYVQRGVRAGDYVRVDTELIYHQRAITALLRTLDAHFATQDTLSISDLKDLTGASRKWTMPLIAWLDKERYTARQGEIRKRHPRWSGPFTGVHEKP